MHKVHKSSKIYNSSLNRFDAISAYWTAMDLAIFKKSVIYGSSLIVGMHVPTWPQTSRSGYLTTASTFLALFLMKNKVKTTMRTGEQL